jgi:hypothetical protein
MRPPLRGLMLCALATSIAGAAPVRVVHISQPVVEPHCDLGFSSHVRHIVRDRYPQLRRCYMVVAQYHPDVIGVATLTFVIEADGRVSSASAPGTLPRSVRACLADEERTWRFPITESATLVHYPLAFRLGEP